MKATVNVVSRRPYRTPSNYNIEPNGTQTYFHRSHEGDSSWLPGGVFSHSRAQDRFICFYSDAWVNEYRWRGF